MIAYPELGLDHGGNAPEGPALGGKARRYRASIQQPTKAGPGLLIEPQ
ncbi:hypothetical protein HPT29_018610 [Microvirga terrae]|uniref:Uncharacterized protein n=1 Tax=Microvirga terrae TaxID=2740529 RepID=A0ABY5RMN0_9HYPH|nr:hypothetical protein [Microvirga terrae]UVF18485.1 hypothetical protein HPT29_018610 [Microvirga terrae]